MNSLPLSLKLTNLKDFIISNQLVTDKLLLMKLIKNVLMDLLGLSMDKASCLKSKAKLN